MSKWFDKAYNFVNVCQIIFLNVIRNNGTFSFTIISLRVREMLLFFLQCVYLVQK